MSKKQYHLADGLLLRTDGQIACVHDSLKNCTTKISDPNQIALLTQLALGGEFLESEPGFEALKLQGFITPGPTVPDPLVVLRLKQIDAAFLAPDLNVWSPKAQKAYELTLNAHAQRKIRSLDVGQCPTLPETSLRRALLVGDADLVGRKSVLCLGDDDLVSVALAALGHSVTVIDIDAVLIDFLGAWAKNYGLDIRPQVQNFLTPIPESLLERFDVFLTDPMSNRACFEIFLSRAISMLKPEGCGFVAVYGPTERIFKEVAETLALPITAWRARHNRYIAYSLGLGSYESDWVSVTKTKNTRPVLAANESTSAHRLYSEAIFPKPPTSLTLYDAIGDLPRATPLYLEQALDLALAMAGEKLKGCLSYAGEGWSVLHGATTNGHITLHVDRKSRQIKVEIYPAQSALVSSVHQILMRGYKPTPQKVQSRQKIGFLDLRLY